MGVYRNSNVKNSFNFPFHCTDKKSSHFLSTNKNSSLHLLTVDLKNYTCTFR